LPTDGVSATIPLARWADQQLKTLARTNGSAAIAALSGSALLGERAALNGFINRGRRSAGGKCHLLAAQGSWVALNLARDDDRELLPALFGQRMIDPADLGEIAELVFACDAGELVARGREMGLALAHSAEQPDCKPIEVLQSGEQTGARQHAPLVVDLSSLWAGPLAGNLLHLIGAEILKVESTARPDAMRLGDPALFARLNGGKCSVALDFSTADGLAALNRLLVRADIVIEASRPRALRQSGIDADWLVATRPGKVWLTITAHGASGAAADWVGFGDDCGVAGGLSAALASASGTMGFVGDAIADPLTGIVAAAVASEAWASGRGGRFGIAMSAVTAQALREELEFDPAALDSEFKAWSAAHLRPFPAVDAREPAGPVRLFGADTARWAAC